MSIKTEEAIKIISNSRTVEEMHGIGRKEEMARQQVIADLLAQPSLSEKGTEEAKIVETIIRQHLKDVEQEYQMGGLSNGLYADYASEVARRALATYKASIERDLKDKQ